MSDLISREKAKEIIRSGFSNHCCCKDICDSIDELQTAYDVDNVVDKISETGEKFCNSVSCEDSPHGLAYKCRECEHYSFTKTIIEIVKAGEKMEDRCMICGAPVPKGEVICSECLAEDFCGSDYEKNKADIKQMRKKSNGNKLINKMLDFMEKVNEKWIKED